MAPNAGVFFEKSLSNQQQSELFQYITEISTETSECWNDETTLGYNFDVGIDKIIPRNEDEKGGTFSIYIWSGLIAEAGGSYEIEKFELEQLKAISGYYPHGHIQVDASSSDRINHYLLGKVLLHIAELFNGFIDFYATLSPHSILPKELQEAIFESYGSGKTAPWSTIEPYFEEMTKDFDGNVYGIEDEDSPNGAHPRHICDPKFMKSWLSHPLFQM